MMKEIFYKSNYISPLGNITIVSNDCYLVGLWFENQKYEFESLENKKVIVSNNNEVLLRTKIWLDAYFANMKPNIKELKLNPIGTEFQKLVWSLLISIPYGKTTSYNELAKKIALKLNRNKISPRCVANAIAHNHISIIIPCHRVIRSDGNISGYAGNVSKKIKLLKHEGVKQFD